MAQVKLDIDELNAMQLAARLRAIAGSLDGNPSVPTAAPPVDTLTDAATNLETLYAAQKQKEAAATAATSATEAAIAAARNLLRTEARTVQTATGGDATKILTTGFAVEKEREAAQTLPAPANLQASYGDEAGEIDLQWSPLPGRPFYTVEIADTATGPYRHAGNCTRSKYTLQGLVSGQLYLVRLRGENSAGPGTPTNPIQQRAA